MLAMFWDETHHALAESAQRWVDRHIAPHAAWICGNLGLDGDAPDKEQLSLFEPQTIHHP